MLLGEPEAGRLTALSLARPTMDVGQMQKQLAGVQIAALRFRLAVALRQKLSPFGQAAGLATTLLQEFHRLASLGKVCL